MLLLTFGWVADWAVAVDTCEDDAKTGCQADHMALLQSKLAAHDLTFGPCPHNDTTLCKALREAVSKKVLCGAQVHHYKFNSFSRKCHELVPAFVVYPTSAEEVQAAIKLTRKYQRTFSVRGGGHNYVCTGFKKDSVHLDMRRFRNFAFHASEGYGLAELGPGLMNGDMAAMIPPGYQYAIGSCPNVGVAGFLLHGGSSPRTTWLGNTTLYSIDVVTADGEMLTVSEATPHDGLWTAMRQAGSSFAVATKLVLKLPAKPQRTFALIPVIKGSFDNLLRAIRQPISDSDDWRGLFRYDQILPFGSWNLKIAAPTDRDLKTILDKLVKWSNEFFLVLDVAAVWLEKEWGLSMSEPDAGSSGRFFNDSTWREAAKVMERFYINRTHSCWYDLGPLKGKGEPVFLDISCYTPESVRELREYINEHLDVMNTGSVRYYNLPLEGTPRDEFWPNYDELAAIKDTWDPNDFFNISNGIHPIRK